MRSLWEVIDLQLDEGPEPALTYGKFDARTGHGYGAVPGGKFSATGSPIPVNTANQANAQYPYADPDTHEDEDEDDDDWTRFLNDPDFRPKFLTKMGMPTHADDPSPSFDKRSFVGNDLFAISEGPGASEPYPAQMPIDTPSKSTRMYKNRGPVAGGTAPLMGRQSAGAHTIGSKAGWSSSPPVRFDLDNFIVYRLQDMPSNDQRAVMRAAQSPEIVEK